MSTEQPPQRASSTDNPPATPDFDTKFNSTEPIFFFHHIIDAENATLQTQVLGPNLSNTFAHDRAKTLFSPSRIADALKRKTTGFLALIPPGNDATRTILAWAESGHGHNRGGDLLESKPAVLSNRLWTSRVMKLARVLELNMGHPYDRLTLGGKVGMFRASHVEVKLAVHAIYVLLKIFNIPTEKVTAKELSILTSKTWGDGSHPRFEIYFSKKNCSACAKYVRKLEALTGVEMKLLWKDRLVKIEYVKKGMGQQQAVDPPGEVVAVEDSEEDEEVDEIEMVDLTEESDEVEAVVEDTPQPLGVYIDGLAYCVGQMGSEPERVKDAIVALAAISTRQKALRAARDGLGRVQRREARRQRTVVPPRARGGCDARLEQGESVNRGRLQCPRTPVPERNHSTWLATPPPSDRRIVQQCQDTSAWTSSAANRPEQIEDGNRSPRQYSFVGGERLSLVR